MNLDLWTVLPEILLLLVFAFLLGALAERLKQSAVLGYLLAGTICGPFIFSAHAVHNLAELGVALLLFTIGLEFSIGKLRRIGNIAAIGGSMQVIVTALVFTLFFRLFRPWNTAVALSFMVALSSTAIVLRVLTDHAEIDSVRGRSVLGILLLQDMAVVPLVLIVSIMGDQSGEGSVAGKIAFILFAAAGLVVGFYFIFYHIVPHLLKQTEIMRSGDLVSLLGIISALGAAWIFHAVGLSAALGAFLAGIILAESPYATQVRVQISSIRALFVTLFFTSIGLLAEPKWILWNLPLVLFGVLVVFGLKTVIVYFVARLFRIGRLNSLAVGISLAQVGEFAFVLGMGARQYGLIIEKTFNLIVSVTIISMFVSPMLVAKASAISLWLWRKLFRTPVAGEIQSNESIPKDHQKTIIIGFGPAGQKVAEVLTENEKIPMIVEQNPGTAKKAQSLGLPVLIGDATHDEILIHAGIRGAEMVVVTLPNPESTVAVIANIRDIAPRARIVARARYHRFLSDLEKAGAFRVVDEENEVGVHLARQALELINRHS